MVNHERSSLEATSLPRPGQMVCWRDPRHAQALGWLHGYGPGPFEVVRIVDKADLGIPPGVVVKTKLGDRDINEVWLALVDGPCDSVERVACPCVPTVLLPVEAVA